MLTLLFVKILTWFLVILAISVGLTKTHLLDEVRDFLCYYNDSWLIKKVVQLLRCPICMSFWVGFYLPDSIRLPGNCIVNGLLATGCMIIVYPILWRIAYKYESF